MSENEGRLAVHAWGFFDDEGNPRLPSGVAVSGETAYEAFQRVEANITHHGGRIEERRATRTLDGWFVGAEFVTPARERAARMWHVITRESDGWPTPHPDHPEAEEQR